MCFLGTYPQCEALFQIRWKMEIAQLQACRYSTFFCLGHLTNYHVLCVPKEDVGRGGARRTSNMLGLAEGGVRAILETKHKEYFEKYTLCFVAPEHTNMEIIYGMWMN